MRGEVIVVGGGFSGLAAAAALSKRGARVTVLEAAAPYDHKFRGELIHPRGVRALAALGLTKPLFEAGGVAVGGFVATPDASSAPAVLPYDTEQGPGLGIDHHAMVMTMRREVGAMRNVTIHTGLRVGELIRKDARIVGARRIDGSEFKADLVVLADGRQSRLRAQLGLEPEIKLLSYTVAFGTDGELPWGRFGHVFLGAPGPILAYPYAEGRIRFCVDIPLGAAKGKDAILAFLKTAYVPFVPESLRAGMLASLDSGAFEGCANHSISTQACAAPGVVMVGDSGGCAHPLTASGMTNAMNDVLTLADVFGQRGATNKALREYQRRRYDFVRMRELFTDALYEVFRGNDDGSLALQRGVFRYWQSGSRSRRASMNILSGEDVRPSAFVSEYSRVFGISALDVFRGVVRKPVIRKRTSTFRSLVKTSAGRIEAAVGRTARTVVDRYRLELHSVP